MFGDFEEMNRKWNRKNQNELEKWVGKLTRKINREKLKMK